MDDELLVTLQYELGEVTDWEELCPGVYSLTVLPSPDSEYSCGEFYLIQPDTSISQEARALGKPLPGSSALLYPIDPPEEGAWTAILYELCKAQNIPGQSSVDAAMEGMELCSSYFGSFPAPPDTPWGWTLRHRALDNGVYWMETSRSETVLAVCHPIWSTELSDGVIQAGKKLAHDKADDVDLGYLFFDSETSCAALFELLKVRSQWLDDGLIRKTELMNAIWRYQPGYAMEYNTQEQTGLNDALGLLLQTLGAEDVELEGASEYMIAFDPDAGTDFIGFWR